MKRMSEQDLKDLVIASTSEEPHVLAYIARSAPKLIAALVAEREAHDRLHRELTSIKNSIGGGA